MQVHNNFWMLKYVHYLNQYIILGCKIGPTSNGLSIFFNTKLYVFYFIYVHLEIFEWLTSYLKYKEKESLYIKLATPLPSSFKAVGLLFSEGTVVSVF